MTYPPLLRLRSSAEYRLHFENTYCRHTITTFDGIAVRFRTRNFNHCFFESTKRDGVKDSFSPKRAERMDWIKIALEDCNSERYCGWDKSRKCYDRRRRVAVVMNNYVVVISLRDSKTGEFLTAYVADSVGVGSGRSTLDKIRQGPKWTSA